MMRNSTDLSTLDGALGAQLARLQRLSLITGIVGAVICLVGLFINSAQFFQAYLFAYIFWAQLAIGCLLLLMIQHVAGGGWGFIIRRFLEAGAMTLPLLAVLFIPILLGIQILYPWARPEVMAESEILRHKAPYLNLPFFAIRTAIYFAIWIGLAYFLNKWSRAQDNDPEAAPLQRFQQLSGPGLVISFLALTFASFDWMMSLEPEWFSTIYGFMFGVGAGAAAFAGAILVLARFANHKPLSEVVTVGHFNDLGNFLLATVMLWAYIALSQYLIIWSGNLPEEITWYVYRTQNNWQWLSLFLILFHFALPFLVLMSRQVKRKARNLTIVAVVIMVTRLVDLYWLVMPAFYHSGIHLDWLDILMPIALGGLWFAVFIWQLKQKPIIALNDPHLPEVAEHGASEAPSRSY
jgi:hypothetical protein